ncbi:MAG: hypothetical protein WC107_01290 [Patescibacteria group bacterium]
MTIELGKQVQDGNSPIPDGPSRQQSSTLEGPPLPFLSEGPADTTPIPQAVAGYCGQHGFTGRRAGVAEITGEVVNESFL